LLRTTLALLGLAALARCANPAGAAQNSADTVTKAVFANDMPGVDANFDSSLQSQVNRAQVGALSDKMHALGEYKGLTFVSSDPSKNEYTYRADFDRGMMNVVVRLDADGKLSAYRVFPQS
jgi:hypothetical protein